MSLLLKWRDNMSGTTSGGLKTATKLLGRNPNHYRDMGKIGGKATGVKGFARNPELARIAGAKGGRISRRGKKVQTDFFNVDSMVFPEPKKTIFDQIKGLFRRK